MKKANPDIPPTEKAPAAELIREAKQKLANAQSLGANGLKTSLHDLPLYILAGSAGAGKTTAFLASGLSPQLLAGHVQQETTILPTSVCNLWYASGSLFAEAGGRFFNGDPQDWRALLSSLKNEKHWWAQRLRNASATTALRGLVWFCDISTFLGMPDPQRTAALGHSVREYLLTVGEVFGSSFPVYFVFTKADLLPQFTAFFHRMQEEHSKQVLGCTLPASALPDASEVYAEAFTRTLLGSFNRLYLRLADKRLTLLTREPDKTRKPGVYEFPREVKRIRDSVVQFLVETFRPNPLQPGPLLRGFYFTGVQEIPVAATTSSIAAAPLSSRAASLEATVLFQANMVASDSDRESPAAEQTASRLCFATNLFHKVILRDQLGPVAASRNVRRERTRKILYASAAALNVLLACCWAISWWGNRKLLSNIAEAAQASIVSNATKTPPSLPELQSMDRLRDALVPLLEYKRNGAPYHLRWGLYSGNRIRDRVYDAYFQLFDHYFLSRVEAEFARRLAALPPKADAQSYNALYDSLKAYRMTTAGTCPANAAFLAPVVYRAWPSSESLEGEPARFAEQQVQFYSKELARHNPYRLEENAELVENGQRFLMSFGGVDRLVRGLIDGASGPPRRPARVTDIAPRFRQVLSGQVEVPAAFTLDGLQYVQDRLRHPESLSAGENCVIGSSVQSRAPLSGPRLAAQLRDSYQRVYVQTWKTFLSSMAVQPFRSPADAAQKLDVLADNRSPLLAVLFLTAQNTNVAAPQQVQAKSTSEKEGFAGRLFAIALKDRSKLSENPAQADDLKEFLRVFQPVREVVRAGNPDRLIDDPNREYMNAVGQMQQAMARLQNYSESNPDATLQQDAQRAADAGMQSVRQIAQRFNINGSEGIDAEVRRLLEAPFRESLRSIVLDPSKLERDKVAGAAGAFCRKLQALQRTFPFNPQSDIDATADQIAAVFAPHTGALSLFEQQLGNAIVRQGRQWVQDTSAPGPKLSAAALQNLNHLTAIAEALYPDGTKHLRLQYAITPLPGAGIEAIALDIDGQKLTAANGQEQSKTLEWPGPFGSQAVLVRVKAGANIPFASYDGMWGVFRMVNDADPRAPGSRVIELSKVRRGHGRPESVLDQNDRPIQVRFQITPGSGDTDIFEKTFFQVKCPGGTVQ